MIWSGVLWSSFNETPCNYPNCKDRNKCKKNNKQHCEPQQQNNCEDKKCKDDCYEDKKCYKKCKDDCYEDKKCKDDCYEEDNNCSINTITPIFVPYSLFPDLKKKSPCKKTKYFKSFI